MRRGSRQEEGQWVCGRESGRGPRKPQNAALHYIISYRRLFDYSGERGGEQTKESPVKSSKIFNYLSADPTPPPPSAKV